MNGIVIREIKKGDNQQIAAVIREVFISDNYPKTGTAFADMQLDFMFETFTSKRLFPQEATKNNKTKNENIRRK